MIRANMEELILISQAVSLSVVFYVVIYFLITWYWPATLLSVFVCTFVLYFLIDQRRHASRARPVGLVPSLAPNHAHASSRQLGGRLGSLAE